MALATLTLIPALARRSSTSSLEGPRQRQVTVPDTPSGLISVAVIGLPACGRTWDMTTRAVSASLVTVTVTESRPVFLPSKARRVTW